VQQGSQVLLGNNCLALSLASWLDCKTDWIPEQQATLWPSPTHFPHAEQGLATWEHFSSVIALLRMVQCACIILDILSNYYSIIGC